MPFIRDFLRYSAITLPLLVGAVAFFWAGLALSAEKPLSSAVKVCLAMDCKSGHGSGVSIGNGYFITAAHVVQAKRSPEFFLRAEDNRIIKAKAVWVLSTADLALLKVDLPPQQKTFDFPASQIACRAPRVGEEVTAIGNPHQIQFAHVSGYAASGPEDVKGNDLFFRPQSTSKAQDIGTWKDIYIFVLPVFFGFSGGPIFDDEGRVLGLLVGGLQGTSYAVIEPVQKLCGILPDLGGAK